MMLPSRLRVAFVLATGLVLAGCVDRFPQLALFPHSQFVTTDDINLRSAQDVDSSIVARVPKGTVVTPVGRTGSECHACWEVDTPEGVGWVSTVFLAPLPHPDE
jgi:SH3 domain-containing protein